MFTAPGAEAVCGTSALPALVASDGWYLVPERVSQRRGCAVALIGLAIPRLRRKG